MKGAWNRDEAGFIVKGIDCCPTFMRATVAQGALVVRSLVAAPGPERHRVESQAGGLDDVWRGESSHDVFPFSPGRAGCSGPGARAGDADCEAGERVFGGGLSPSIRRHIPADRQPALEVLGLELDDVSLDGMVRRVYSHLGTVQHRSEVVEYRVERHFGRLGDMLRAESG